MTEEEAKTKWCPIISQGGQMVRPASNYSGAISTNAVWENCIASDCMMWVWLDHNIHTLEDGKVADGYGNMRSADGCCGLAR